MNKTVTINISGIIFHIEEDAYEKLSRYLVTIKGYFSKTEGGNEIMSDIEARVAELLQEKINAGKQVVLMADVEHVMQVMGKPEEFAAEGPQEEKTGDKAGDKTTGEQYYTGEKIRRRLFRNPEEKTIGGVCSGLAAYFDIDTVWVRLAMFLLIFFGGLSLWVYIIMWMIIPEAKTTADKFAMRGEPANINNIMKNFKEEAEDVKNRVHRAGRDFRDQRYGENLRSGAASVLSVLFNILGRFIGFVILCVGLALMFGYVTSIMGISVFGSNASVSHWKTVLFESSSDYMLSIVAFIIVFGIPVFMLIYAGIKLLFRIHYRNRWLNLSLGITWLFGLIIGSYIAITALWHFSDGSTARQTSILRGTGDTLVIKMSPATNNLRAMDVDNKNRLENYFNSSHWGYAFAEYGNKLGIIGYAGLSITESDSDSIEIVIARTSRGDTEKDADENAETIRYSYALDKNVLLLDEVFFTEPGSMFRAQQVDVRVRLPKGKVVNLDKSLRFMLDGVRNVTNTRDVDMVARRWEMTGKGLKCVDCENLKKGRSHHYTHDEEVNIGPGSIEVNSQDANIKFDNDGIRIRTTDKDWELKDSSDRDDNNKEDK